MKLSGNILTLNNNNISITDINNITTDANIIKYFSYNVSKNKLNIFKADKILNTTSSNIITISNNYTSFNVSNDSRIAIYDNTLNKCYITEIVDIISNPGKYSFIKYKKITKYKRKKVIDGLELTNELGVLIGLTILYSSFSKRDKSIKWYLTAGNFKTFTTLLEKLFESVPVIVKKEIDNDKFQVELINKNDLTDFFVKHFIVGNYKEMPEWLLSANDTFIYGLLKPILSRGKMQLNKRKSQYQFSIISKNKPLIHFLYELVNLKYENDCIVYANNKNNNYSVFNTSVNYRVLSLLKSVGVKSERCNYKVANNNKLQQLEINNQLEIVPCGTFQFKLSDKEMAVSEISNGVVMSNNIII
jgi:hypothetical protein